MLGQAIERIKVSYKADLQHPASWYSEDMTQPTGASQSLLCANMKYEIIKEHSPLSTSRWEGGKGKGNRG